MNRSVIKAGTCILAEEPFVYSLSGKYRQTRCDFCLKNPPKLFKCSGCAYVYYCGAQCQTTGWAMHKHECAKLKLCATTTDNIPDGLRMMAKLVIKLQHGGGYDLRSYYTKTESRKFRDLMSHEKEINEDETRMDYFESCMMPFLKRFFSDQAVEPSAKEMLQIFGKMSVNSFSVLDGEMNSIGTGLYLAASILDHNCQPNAVATFDGRTLNIRTLVDMPHLSWDNIFISYIDQMDDAETRRKALKKNYYFLCGCSKCVLHDKDELNLYPALCPECAGQYCVSRSKCSTANCKYWATKKYKDEYQEISEFSKMKLAEMSNTAYLDMAKVCLKRQENLLHPLNLLRVKTLDNAFESAITLEKLEEAAEFGKELLPGLIKHLGDRNPLVGVLLLKMGKLFDFLELDNAEDYLRDAARILKITHGESSTIYREGLMPLLMNYS